MTVMVCRFGRKVRWVAFFDQGRFLPKVVFLPQCAQVAMIKFLSRYLNKQVELMIAKPFLKRANHTILHDQLQDLGEHIFLEHAARTV